VPEVKLLLALITIVFLFFALVNEEFLLAQPAIFYCFVIKHFFVLFYSFRNSQTYSFQTNKNSSNVSYIKKILALFIYFPVLGVSIAFNAAEELQEACNHSINLADGG
jgi:hypothetical protein